MANLLKTTWHNFPAFTLESELVSVIIVPDLGAKIVSLFDKTHKREWLVPPMRPLKQNVYGADFVSQDMSGWDEMFPTIVACQLEETALPDHGEVWSLPWRQENGSDSVVLSVSGVALSYQLTRSARLAAPDCLVLSYTLKNNTLAVLPCLWAAHPQFAVDGHTRIVLPPEVTQVINAMDGTSEWGQAGTSYSWPATRSQNGQNWHLNRVRGAEQQACRKFYLPPESPVAWAALVDETLGCQLRLEWSSLELPYLGLWVDEGLYNALPVAAFEPSDGYFDSLKLAIDNKRVVEMLPGQERKWSLQIRLVSSAKS